MFYGCYFNDFQQEKSGEEQYSSRGNGSDLGYEGILCIKFDKRTVLNFILEKLLTVSIIQRCEVFLSCYQKEFKKLRSLVLSHSNPFETIQNILQSIKISLTHLLLSVSTATSLV